MIATRAPSKSRRAERGRALAPASPSPTPRVTLATATRYQLHQLRYQYDPVGWIERLVRFPAGDGLVDYQREIAAALVEHKRATARGPHGLGKTALAALIVLWFATTRDGTDWKVVTTASNWRQLTKYLWPEIHKWARLVDWVALGMDQPREGKELLDLSLKLETGEAFATASSDPAALEGAHAEHLLYVFDEGKAIGGATFDAAEGAFSGAGKDTGREALALAISTPGIGPSRFRDIHERKAGYEDWWVKRVSLEDAIAAGRISRQWAEQRARLWGEGSPIYITRVKGEFAEQDESGVIPIEWINAAVERWHARNETGEFADAPVAYVSADVSDGGADPSVIGRLSGETDAHGPSVLGFQEVLQTGAGETMKLVGAIKALLDAHGCGAVVDSIGVGAGVFSRLRELKARVTAFNAAEKSTGVSRGRERFANLRAEAWWTMREALDPVDGDDWALPPNDRMIGDLAAPGWYYRSDGRIVIESKEDKEDEDGTVKQGLRSRLKRSTDYGDVVVMGRWALTRRPTGKLKLGPAWQGAR